MYVGSALKCAYVTCMTIIVNRHHLVYSVINAPDLMFIASDLIFIASHLMFIASHLMLIAPDLMLLHQTSSAVAHITADCTLMYVCRSRSSCV